MNIERILVPHFGTNCYLVWSKKEAAIIDPGEGLEEILKRIKEKELDLKYIILTHGHFDHILAVYDLKRLTNAKVAIHKEDADMLTNANLSLASKYNIPQKSVTADMFLDEGSKIEIGDECFDVIHTPGHSKGSICLKCGDILLSGDTLFKQTVGIYTSVNKEIMKASVKKILSLPDETRVYPGHNEFTTIGSEKKENPFANFDWEWE